MNNCASVVGIIAGVVLFATAALAEVTAERSDRGVIVKIDGELFTEYLTKAGQSPAMWPVVGPGGKLMTRSYPVAEAPSGVKETDDHPHHQSVWFTHDKVNGADYWEGNRNDRDAKRGPHIDHREFVEVKNLGDTARVVTRNDWMNGNKRICEDERAVVFGTRPNGDRWIDFTITLKAIDGDVTFGDTKEGTFAVRVADSMRVDAKLGGQIVNSDGLKDQNAWGLPAKWVDYNGPVNVVWSGDSPAENDDANWKDDVVGICLMSHPKSFRPTPRWHVRTYGLFTANPFGKADFPKPEAYDQGPATIKQGDSLTLRYRILLHEGRTDPAAINEAFEEFAVD